MHPNTNLSKTFRRRLIRVSHQSLICSLVGIALLSESVLAIPSSMEIQIAQQPVITEPNATSAAAEKAFDEAEQLYGQGDKASLQQAIVKYQEALKLLPQVGDRGGEAAILTGIGAVYSALGEQRQALTYLKQALPLLRGGGEANTLNNIGGVYWNLGEQEEALRGLQLNKPPFSLELRMKLLNHKN